ncbi:MAG: hypothetical protein ACLGHG_05870 [Gammaproteobacteria bacterium]
MIEQFGSQVVRLEFADNCCGQQIVARPLSFDYGVAVSNASEGWLIIEQSALEPDGEI